MINFSGFVIKRIILFVSTYFEESPLWGQGDRVYPVSSKSGVNYKFSIYMQGSK